MLFLDYGSTVPSSAGETRYNVEKSVSKAAVRTTKQAAVNVGRESIDDEKMECEARFRNGHRLQVHIKTPFLTAALSIRIC